MPPQSHGVNRAQKKRGGGEMKSLSAKYGPAAMTLHWVVAFLLATALVLAWVLPRKTAPGYDAILELHKSIGILVLVLVVPRLLWRLGNPVAAGGQPDPARNPAFGAHALGALCHHAAHSLDRVFVLLGPRAGPRLLRPLQGGLATSNRSECFRPDGVPAQERAIRDLRICGFACPGGALSSFRQARRRAAARCCRCAAREDD